MQKSHSERLADLERRVLVVLQGSKHVAAKNGDWQHAAGMAIAAVALGRATDEMGPRNSPSMSSAHEVNRLVHKAFDTADEIVGKAEDWINVQFQYYPGFEAAIPEEPESEGGACAGGACGIGGGFGRSLSMGGAGSLGGGVNLRNHVDPITAAIDALITEMSVEDMRAVIVIGCRTHLGLSLEVMDFTTRFIWQFSRTFMKREDCTIGTVGDLKRHALRSFLVEDSAKT